MSSAQAKNKNFARYARYYDLLYQSKDYAAEALFVHERLKAAGAKKGSLLELGCGTGRHAIAFSGLGWTVTGVDKSKPMITQARHRAAAAGKLPGGKPSFHVADIAKLRAGVAHDAVASLFHVFGYQTANRGLQALMQSAARR